MTTSDKLYVDLAALETALQAMRPEILDGYVTLAKIGDIPCSQIDILTSMRIEAIRPVMHGFVKNYLENCNKDLVVTKPEDAGLPRNLTADNFLDHFPTKDSDNGK